MSTDYDKPLPDVHDPATQPFWTGAKAHRLLCQRCGRCSSLRWTPRSVCPECLSFESDWVEIRPTGHLYSYTTYYRAFDKRFAADVPYSVGQIQLDDGPRMIGLLQADPAAIVVGGRVRAVFEPVTREVTLVRWALA
jgi:hypothetical protein